MENQRYRTSWICPDTESHSRITLMEITLYKMIELTPHCLKSSIISLLAHLDCKCLGTTLKNKRCGMNTNQFLCRYHKDQYSFILLKIIKVTNTYYEFIKVLSRYSSSFEFFYENLLIVNDEKKECVVCYETTEKIFKTSCCHNVYCKECITSWSKSKNSCPMCRKQLISITS